MNMFVIDNVIWVRLGSFTGIFLLMAVWEIAAPRRVLRTPKGARWFNNLSITALNSLMGRFIFPLQAAALSLVAQERGLGLFPYLNVPSLPRVFCPCAPRPCHIPSAEVFHRVRVFWYFHVCTHGPEIDVTTGAPVPPVEIRAFLLIRWDHSALGNTCMVFHRFRGAPNATSMFNHSNISISTTVDKVLRLIVVTPDMHRVHHSVINRGTRQQFRFQLPGGTACSIHIRASPGTDIGT